MTRREFLAVSAMTAVAGPMGATKRLDAHEYRLIGVPLRSGSLYPGNENDAQAYRDAHIVDLMRAAGVQITDEGNVAIPSYLPHHAMPPIRNWPGPRIAWECVRDRVTPYLKGGDVPLLIGCDCSVVVGTTEALMEVAGPDRVHVIYVDGDFDDAPPEAAKMNSAASVGVWLLTHPSPFWVGPVLKSSQITVVGWTNASHAEPGRVGSVSREEVERVGAIVAAKKVLAGIPADAAVLLHFDIDVMRASEMTAAYFPHALGLGFAETAQLVGELLKDSRVRLIEVSEYAALRDGDGREAGRLVTLLTKGLTGQDRLASDRA
jgi:arginase